MTQMNNPKVDLEYYELLQRLRILSDKANQLGHELNMIISDFNEKQMKDFLKID